jgi:hypothetical protein
MLNLLKNIDVQRLSGVNSILGIDISDKQVHIVEVKRRGGVFNKYSGRFEVHKFIKEEFPDGISAGDREGFLRDLLAKHKVSGKYAVSAIQSGGVKLTTATVASSVTNIDQWIRENHDSILRLNLSLNQVSFAYELRDRNESGSVVEIAFVRNSELEEHRKLFEAMGVELIALGAGTRDALNALIATKANSQDVTLIHFRDQSLTVTHLLNGVRRKVELRSIDSSFDLVELRDGFKAKSSNVIFSGNLPNVFQFENHEILKPLNLPTEFTLAVGLAVKGLLPEISPVNLLNPSEQIRFESNVYKRLTQKAALALGAVVILALTLGLIASALLRGRIDALDAQMNSNGAAYTSLRMLENQVRVMDRNVNGAESVVGRSEYARILYDIATAAPESLWLDKLTIEEKGVHECEASLIGFTRSDETIAEFLKRLQLIRDVSDVELVRSGYESGSGKIVPARNNLSGVVDFEAKVSVGESKH